MKWNGPSQFSAGSCYTACGIARAPVFVPHTMRASDRHRGYAADRLIFPRR